MEYKQSMNLVSPSGYAMPFELSETTPLEITLGYGKQTHPVTGKEFFRHSCISPWQYNHVIQRS